MFNVITVELYTIFILFTIAVLLSNSKSSYFTAYYYLYKFFCRAAKVLFSWILYIKYHVTHQVRVHTVDFSDVTEFSTVACINGDYVIKNKHQVLKHIDNRLTDPCLKDACTGWTNNQEHNRIFAQEKSPTMLFAGTSIHHESGYNDDLSIVSNQVHHPVKCRLLPFID